MRTTTLGRDGPTVSRIGLGLAALGRPGYMTLGHADDFEQGRSVEAMRAQAHAVMSEAWALGIRYFDAARSYGRAEEFLAGWPAPGPVVVGSKWGYRYTAGWKSDAPVHEVKDHSLAAFEAQWEQTRRVLGDRVDLYQIHSATFETGVLEDEALMNRLFELRARGVLVGLSVTGARQAAVLERALAVRVDGVPLFQSVQATWNLRERSVGPALEEAHQAGLGVIIKEPLANGRLTSRGELSDESLALAAVLAQPFVDVVLCGATTVEQLRSNVRALDVGEAEVARVLRDFPPESPEEYWSQRSKLRWS